MSGRDVRVVYPMSVLLVARLLSAVLTCSMGGDGQAGEWMTGAERRCIDEYALAVKGGEGGRMDLLPYRRVWRSRTRWYGLGRATLIGGVPAYARNQRVQLCLLGSF